MGPKNNVFTYILGFLRYFFIKFFRIDRYRRGMSFFGIFLILDQIFPNLGNKYGIFGLKDNVFFYIFGFPCYFLLKVCWIDCYITEMWFWGYCFIFALISPNFYNKYAIIELKNNNFCLYLGISLLFFTLILLDWPLYDSKSGFRKNGVLPLFFVQIWDFRAKNEIFAYVLRFPCYF